MEQVIGGSTRVLIIEADGSAEEASGAKATVADKILDRAMKE
jgi:hypothetical protein